MAIIFDPKQAGVVVAVHVGKAMPGAVRIRDLDTTYMTIVSMGRSQDANVQVSPSLRNNIYVYTFGDRIGMLALGVVAFHRTCNDRGGEQNAFQGFKAIEDFYREKGLRKQASPVLISVGVTSIRGFLVGYDMEATQPETNLITGQLRFIVPPVPDSQKKGGR